ncbi:DUF2207 domain-containing protein [Candidatus Saccharibacteria bacterium]|nr:DUF2207 domain-containing protein [Candidatus Saccharibacteria bacterium]
MKKICAFLIAMIATLMTVPVYAGVNDFYFSDFTADYYLTKDAEGVSRLKVVENVTAEFPNYNQNKGICRYIPFTNQDNANVTLPHLTRSDIKVTRNGQVEPIYSIEKEAGKTTNYYSVCTGTDEYVLGSQTYTFEYEFEKVVTEFTDKGKTFQELYWDTNGNGASQKFDKVTARLHFAEPEEWTGGSWCYVGKYGESGQDRCTMTKIEDGVEFTASDLKSGENLTMDVELKAGSFVVPEPEDNYAYVKVIAVLGVICLLCIGIALKKYLATREKTSYYKGLFVKPEYQPNKDYSLPEMAEIFIGKKKDAKVAMLLELVVNRKIEFVRGEKKRQWKIKVNNLDNVSLNYVDLLSILNGGTKPSVGSEIELKTRSATSQLIALKNTMNKRLLKELKEHGLVEEKYHIGESGGRGFGNVIALSIVIVPVVLMVGVFILGLFEDALNLDSTYGGKMIFEEQFFLTAFLMIVFTVIIVVWLWDKKQTYAGHTVEGLKMSKYMDGLELYIRMAEAERMKLLQSVEGADISAEGIVKLYEKLLPYAAIFGLEESWMNEMKEYCQVEEIEEPDYLMNGLAASEISRSLRNAASIATASSTMSSSGGGSSSGFSGGGGGGFSGGGGGGGGFGGR